MKRNIMVALAATALVLGMASCKGRTQENMTPNGDTVESVDLPGMDTGATISGGEVDMNASNTDTTVIADSPAEAAAQATDSAKTK